MQREFKPVIDPVIWQQYPEYRVVSVTAWNFSLVNTPVSGGIPLRPPEWMEAHLEAWRVAFKGFGANPKKTPSSVEALWKRVDKTGELPVIDPVVDLYNELSVRFGAAFGGEDAACYEGVPRLVKAAGGEAFDTMRDGVPVIEQVEAGEIIWRDDRGVTCRRWNWRQCKRTALTATSTALWFVIDRLPPMPVESLVQAGEELVAGLKRLCPEVETTIRLLEPSA